jgi:hypothetical protein
VAYPYNGILLSHKRKKELIQVTTGQSLKTLDTNKKKPTKNHILYDSIYMKYPEQADLYRQEGD